MSCNHLIGFTQARVVNAETEEIIVSWLSPFRADDIGKIFSDWKGGYRFKFCPECGENIEALNAGAVSGFKWTVGNAPG
jgi:hypothetical protein